jgi:hypothetical protein
MKQDPFSHSGFRIANADGISTASVNRRRPSTRYEALFFWIGGGRQTGMFAHRPLSCALGKIVLIAELRFEIKHLHLFQKVMPYVIPF